MKHVGDEETWKLFSGPEMLKSAMESEHPDRIKAVMLLASELGSRPPYSNPMSALPEALCTKYYSFPRRDTLKEFHYSQRMRIRVALFSYIEALERFPCANYNFACPIPTLTDKILILHHRILRTHTESVEPKKCAINLPASATLEETLAAIMAKSRAEILTGISVNSSQQGVYANGVFRAWFEELIRKLFASKQQFSKDRNVYRPSDKMEHGLVTGRLLAMSILEGIPIGVQLNHGLLAMLLRKTENWDIEALYRDDPDTLLRHVVDCRTNGDCDHQLVGLSVTGNPVTEANVDEYVQEQIHKHFKRPVYQEIKFGFEEILPNTLFENLLVPEELGSILLGTTEITAEYLRANTEPCYGRMQKRIEWLWDFLGSDPEKMKKFFFFATSRSVGPVGQAMPALQFTEINYWEQIRFQMKLAGLFGSIELPEYPDREALEKDVQQVLDRLS